MAVLLLEACRPIDPPADDGFEVSYVLDDGAEYRVPLAQAWAVPLERGIFDADAGSCPMVMSRAADLGGTATVETSPAGTSGFERSGRASCALYRELSRHRC